MRTLLAFCVALVAACGGSSKTTNTTTTNTTDTGTPPTAAANVGTLKDLQNGDRACYVVVTTAAGEQSLEGDFELCAGGGKDATALVGKEVTWTTHEDHVQAASCQGNPDCQDSDTVQLVDSLSAK